MVNATLEKLSLASRLTSESDSSEDGMHVPDLVDDFMQITPPHGTKKLKFRAINRESGADLIARLENAAGIEKPAIKATSKTTSGAAEKTAEKTFSAAATSQISSAVSYSSAPVRKFGEPPDALKKLISELREHSKNSEKPASKLPERTGQNSASESVSEGIHIERYDKKSQYDILREMFSGRDRTYATLKEFMQNTLEKKLEKINRSEIIYKIDNAPQLIDFYIDFKKKVSDKKNKSKGAVETLERQASELEKSMKIRISNALGNDYYETLRAVTDRDEIFYSRHPELIRASLGSKVNIYNTVNRALEAKTKGMLMPRISGNKIRSEVVNLSEIMYSGKKWTQRVDDIQNALNQIYNSSRKCALNDRELLAISLIKNELANNRYIHGKKTEHRDEEGNLQVTYTGIRKTKDMNDAANYLRFNSKIKNALTGLDSLAGEGPGILTWPSSAAAKLTDTFSEAATTVEHACQETIRKARAEISDKISDNADAAGNAFKLGYATANVKVRESLSKSIAYTNSIFGKIFSYLAKQAAAKGKSLNEFLTEYYNAGASKYRPENMTGRIEPGTATLQSLTEGIRLPKLSVGDIRLPKLSDYAINSDSIKKAKIAVEYGALAASLIFALYTGKILANAAVSAHSQWQHRPAASQELTSEQRAETMVTGFEAAKEHTQKLAAVQLAELERIAVEEYREKQTAYAAERQQRIDTWFDYPIKSWRADITSWPGLRLNPFRKNTCRKIINSGWKAPGWCWERHDGFDIDGNSGDRIAAFDKGIVVHAGWIRGYGNTIIILHPNGYSTVYGHGKNNGIQVKAGQEVERGQLVMLMGSTGRATGSHLHFELRDDDDGKTLNALNKGVMNAYLGPETLEQLAQVDYIQDPKKIKMPGWLWKRGRVSKGTADAANAYLKKHAETVQLYSAKPKSLITAGGGSIGPKQGVYTQKTR